MNTQSLSDLDGGYQLAPVCEQFLDRTTLGTEGSVEAFVDFITTLYSGEDYDHWSSMMSASDYARHFAEKLDPVTMNVLHAGAVRGDIPDHVFVKIRAQDYGREEARNYALLMMGIEDLPQSAGATRQFNGLHAFVTDSEGNPLERLDLSTDEAYRGNLALLRYSIMVTDRWRDATKLFLRTTSDPDAMIIEPKMVALLWEYQDKVELIASIVVEQKDQNVERLRAMLSGEVEMPLINGVL